MKKIINAAKKKVCPSCRHRCSMLLTSWCCQRHDCVRGRNGNVAAVVAWAADGQVFGFLPRLSVVIVHSRINSTGHEFRRANNPDPLFRRNPAPERTEGRRKQTKIPLFLFGKADDDAVERRPWAAKKAKASSALVEDEDLKCRRSIQRRTTQLMPYHCALHVERTLSFGYNTNTRR